MKWSGRVALFFLAAAFGCATGSRVGSPAPDSYLPKLRANESFFISNHSEPVYRFSQDQIDRMQRTKLDTNRVVRYLESRWPIERLGRYCTETNTWPASYQNLVARHCVVERDLHTAKRGGFDRIWVYVDQDDGRDRYVGLAGTEWVRWTYSLNILRGTNHWAIIETLPNDFMDSDGYARSKPGGAADHPADSRDRHR